MFCFLTKYDLHWSVKARQNLNSYQRSQGHSLGEEGIEKVVNLWVVIVIRLIASSGNEAVLIRKEKINY